MSDPFPPARRATQLPAVLQVRGQAPFFGTVAGVSGDSLSFDFHQDAPAQLIVGSKARLDFDLLDQHHSIDSLLIHIQGSRATLSTQGAPPAALAALHSVNPQNAPHLAAGLSILQRQHACHARFMVAMRAVVDHFYRLLDERIAATPVPAGAAHPLDAVLRLRPTLSGRYTQAYPMYPELDTGRARAAPADGQEQVDMARVDDWIRRSAIAHRIAEAIAPLPEEFSQHYASLRLRKRSHKDAQHPYQPDTVLDVLADLIAPLGLSADDQTACYEIMGQALELEAAALYQSMLDIIGETPQLPMLSQGAAPDLGQWLTEHALPAVGGGPGASGAQVAALTALLGRLADKLESVDLAAVGTTLPADAPHPAAALIPGMLARDRILARFLPAETGFAADMLDSWSGSPDARTGSAAMPYGGLAGLDHAALGALNALLRQPPALDPGPEKLPQASQVRALMLQAQGLLLEYTLNGLTYHAQPDHPAWTLINGLDALHRGADDAGQFLDPVNYQAASLAMQWLLSQDNTDAALVQMNRFLAGINSQLAAEQRSRRQDYLRTQGALLPDRTLLRSGWCVVRRGEDAIPHEVLGTRNGRWILLNRSATRPLEIAADAFLRDFDAGLIEEAGSYDDPFLERIANATLTASLGAVHAFTWKDPASGCLKRSALLDELERRLAHPVTDPPTHCALIEIPTMRPSLSSLPADALTVMQKRTGEMLMETLKPGEHCGRLSDVSFMLVFAPQNPGELAQRIGRLKAAMETLHPEWKMLGAVVPLVDAAAPATPSSVLRRANLACAPVRERAGFDMASLIGFETDASPIEALPFSALYLRCQKIAACGDAAHAHYEILLGVDETLAPRHTTQSFVLMAEQNGLSRSLDTWVLRTVLDWMDANANAMDSISGLSVNLSGDGLAQREHIDGLAALLAERPHLAGKIILEVTETAAIDNIDNAARGLRALRAQGCRVALDDFGSGYSSYGYLRSLPLDYLKIDGTYIRNILTDKTDQALTTSMVDVAHSLGLKVIAEYVESEAAYAWLKDAGVDYVQGYWVHKPERLDSLGAVHG